MNAGDANEDRRGLWGRVVGTHWGRTWYHVYATVSTDCWFIFGVPIRQRIIGNGVSVIWTLVLAARERLSRVIHDRFSTNLPLSSGIQARILYTGCGRICPRIIPDGVLVFWALVLAAGGLSWVIHDRFATDLPVYNAIQPRIRALSTILVRNLPVNTGRRITSGVSIRQRIIANGVLLVWALILATAGG
jgi:hypothetical protein